MTKISLGELINIEFININYVETSNGFCLPLMLPICFSYNPLMCLTPLFIPNRVFCYTTQQSIMLLIQENLHVMDLIELMSPSPLHKETPLKFIGK